jgi:hypothetical protein
MGSVVSIWAAEFSADSVSTYKGKTTTGKIYMKNKFIRMESNHDGYESINIIDLAKKVSYILNSASKTYMEIQVTDQMLATVTADDLGTWKSLGPETINGYLCDKRLYVPKDKQPGDLTVWFSTKLNWSIKSVSSSKQGDMITEYKNIKEGGVSDSLFKIPSDYSKMDIPNMGGKGAVPGM